MTGAASELEIDPALFTPKDQIRKWVRVANWPAEAKINPADFMGGGQKPKKQGT